MAINKTKTINKIKDSNQISYDIVPYMLSTNNSNFIATLPKLEKDEIIATQDWVENTAKAHAANDIIFPNSKIGVPTAAQSLWPSTRANRLSFLPANNILVEQSTDGGKTWTDKTVSDYSKTGLFSQIRPGITIPLKDGKKSCDCMIRITISAMNFNNVPTGTSAEKFAAWTVANVKTTERYCSLSGMFLWLSSNSDKIYCLVEKSTGATPNTWVKDGEGYCTGWSGADFIRLSDGVFGGGSGQTGNYWFRRFTFRTASTKNTFNDSDLSVNYTDATQSISEITAFGPNVWTAANSLMSTDRLYKWDILQNATFPANVRSQSLTSNNGIQGGYINSTSYITAKSYISNPALTINATAHEGIQFKDAAKSTINAQGNAGFYLESKSSSKDYTVLGTKEESRVLFIQPGDTGTVHIGTINNKSEIPSTEYKLIVDKGAQFGHLDTIGGATFGSEVTATSFVEGNQLLSDKYAAKTHQHTFTGTPATLTDSYTPSGTISAPTITVKPSTTTITEVTGKGSLPTLTSTYDATTQTVSLVYTQGSLITTTDTQVMTSASATSSTPSFIGTSGSISISYTPTGSISHE